MSATERHSPRDSLQAKQQVGQSMLALYHGVPTLHTHLYLGTVRGTPTHRTTAPTVCHIGLLAPCDTSLNAHFGPPCVKSGWPIQTLWTVAEILNRPVGASRMQLLEGRFSVGA